MCVVIRDVVMDFWTRNLEPTANTAHSPHSTQSFVAQHYTRYLYQVRMYSCKSRHAVTPSYQRTMNFISNDRFFSSQTNIQRIETHTYVLTVWRVENGNPGNGCLRSYANIQIIARSAGVITAYVGSHETIYGCRSNDTQPSK